MKGKSADCTRTLASPSSIFAHKTANVSKAPRSEFTVNESDSGNGSARSTLACATTFIHVEFKPSQFESRIKNFDSVLIQ